MAMALFLVLLAIRLAIVRGIICNNDQSLGRDVFEEHGCTCGTGASINVSELYTIYRQAYEDCHEDDIGDGHVIDCAFSTQGNDSSIITAMLGRTMLDRLPVDAGDFYKDITCLLLNGNNITHITYEHMKQFPKLRRLYLNTTQLQKIDNDALIDNTELITLNIANNGLEEMPYLGHLWSLETFHVEHNSISSVGPNSFVNNTRLKKLDMSHNKINMMPNVSNLMELRELQLEHNRIPKLPPSNFYGLFSLHRLIIHNNHISRLQNDMCRDMCYLATLDARNNHIKQIDSDAFKGCHIEYLNLDYNDFPWLPYKDIRLTVEEIHVTGVPSLTQFPQAYIRNQLSLNQTVNETTVLNQTFPLLEKLFVHYQIHCCWYEDYKVHAPDGGGGVPLDPDIDEVIIPGIPDNCTNPTTLEEFLACHGNRKRRQLQSNCPVLIDSFRVSNDSFTCSSPKGDDPFHPCYDIIEYLSLRIIIWFVVVISLCGNVLVFTVLLYGAVKKSLTVPQLMIMNLAAADFCLGLYLIFIAAADLDTAGNYFNRAFDWERSAACKTAGFLAVLSSTASICILGLITFERMTTIVFTFSGRRFMTLIRTAVCLAVVWSIAFLFAILPVADTISSYSKASICLPVDTSDTADDVYIAFLLFFTGAVCVFILVCYIILFIRVKKTTSSLTARQEFKIALKMAVLVATDFVIWLPIAMFGLAGAFGGNPIIKLEHARYFLIFLFPLNSCINPVLYSLMQSGFRNQMCDAVAHLGLCKGYHKRRRNRRRGLPFAATNNSRGNRFRLGSITSVTTFTSFMSLLGKRSSVASMGSNECQLQQVTKKSSSSGGSTSSDPNVPRESKLLTPIHESTTPTRERESDAVFYDTELTATMKNVVIEEEQTKDHSTPLQHSDSDSGVANSDRDITPSNSGSSLDHTPQQDNVQDVAKDDVIFHISSTSSTAEMS